MSWSAGHLPVAAVSLARALPPVAVWAAGKALFAGAMVFAFRTLYGAPFAKAAVMSALALVSMVGCFYVQLFAGGITSYLLSPFLLWYAYMAFRGDFGDIANAFRTRQSFRRLMEAAALNPHDAEPHYQLGLVYQQRRQYAEAIERFQRAVAIDKTETDAHFQLGRLAREQGRLDDAMRSLEIVAKQDDKHSFSEVWREIGATHLASGRIPEAEAALTKFVRRRAYDPEGLYLLGEVLARLNRPDEAKDAFQRCVESVKTLPNYRRGVMRKWSKLAQARL
jgi:tetratricopeptide (TPR) repeat protein